MIRFSQMAKRPRIKAGQQPSYPTDQEAKDYAEQHRQYVAGGVDCHEAYGKIKHSPSIDVLTTGGCKNIFFVFAYPPAGFDIAAPEDVLQLKVFEAWILEYNPQGAFYNTLVKASRDGVDFFWKEHGKRSR
jgi:hypothetical protein